MVRDPAVENTDAAGSIFALIVDSILEYDGEDEFVRAHNKVTRFYLCLQEQQVVPTRNGSMQRTGSRALRIVEPEKLLAMVSEEKMQVIATLK